jgi:thiol-disulfide isomerase/thioredoxin
MNLTRAQKMAAMCVIVVLFMALIGVFVMKNKVDFFGDKTTVEYFYMESCPWCQKFMPEWQKFEDAAKAAGIDAKKAEASTAPDKIEMYNIHGFPTVMVTKNGKSEEYQGDRTADALMAFVKTS